MARFDNRLAMHAEIRHGDGWLAYGGRSVAGGALARFDFRFLVVGPLRVERDEGTRRLHVRLNRELALYGVLAPVLTGCAATAVVVLSRVGQLVGDVLWAVFGSSWSWLASRRATGSHVDDDARAEPAPPGPRG